MGMVTTRPVSTQMIVFLSLETRQRIDWAALTTMVTAIVIQMAHGWLIQTA